jgi:hypothetical protein
MVHCRCRNGHFDDVSAMHANGSGKGTACHDYLMPIGNIAPSRFRSAPTPPPPPGLVGLLDQDTTAGPTHFDPEHGGSLYLRNLANTGHKPPSWKKCLNDTWIGGMRYFQRQETGPTLPELQGGQAGVCRFGKLLLDLVSIIILDSSQNYLSILQKSIKYRWDEGCEMSRLLITTATDSPVV